MAAWSLAGVEHLEMFGGISPTHTHTSPFSLLPLGEPLHRSVVLLRCSCPIPPSSYIFVIFYWVRIATKLKVYGLHFPGTERGEDRH